MSGGSFNYLYSKELSDLFDFSVAGEWDHMLDELDILCPEAAAEMRKIKSKADEFQKEHGDRWQALQNVLHAVEWWRSFDWGKDQVDEVITEYRKKLGKETDD